MSHDARGWFVAQGNPGNIVPKLTPAQVAAVQAGDGIYLVWPGTAKHPLSHVVNGGCGEWDAALPGQPQSNRIMWISDGDSTDPTFQGVLYFHHEFMHMVEWAYVEVKFPRKDHPHSRRTEWPADFVGTTEWDFYEQVYRKRVLPSDNLKRMSWRSGKSFYPRFLKEYHGN